MRLAQTQPAWGLGFADEVWESRWAQPAQQRWSEDGSLPRLYTLACAKGGGRPKDLGLLGAAVALLSTACRPNAAPGCGGPPGECGDPRDNKRGAALTEAP
jgi:hypothetical protein